MPEIEVITQSGEKSGKVELPVNIFGVKVNSSLLHEAVRMYRANLRQGTASTKTRGEVSGGGIKPWRQKGTGRARAGSIRSPIWRKGGVVFGPKPRDFSYTMPRRKLKLALSQALSDKLNSGELVVLEKIEIPAPKTKEMVKILKGINSGEKAILVLEKMEGNIKRAGRNISAFTLALAKDLNAYDVLRHHKVILTRQALDSLKERFKDNGTSKSA
jgi:large subunit ribosomal protein L4